MKWTSYLSYFLQVWPNLVSPGPRPNPLSQLLLLYDVRYTIKTSWSIQSFDVNSCVTSKINSLTELFSISSA